MEPASIPLPSSSRASSTADGRARPARTSARNPADGNAPASRQEPKGRMGTGKWPIAPRTHSISSTNSNRPVEPRRVDDYRPNDPSPGGGTGKSFLRFSDTGASHTDSVSSASNVGQTVHTFGPSDPAGTCYGQTGESTAFSTTSPYPDNTSQQTVADSTVRLEGSAPPGPRRSTDGGHSPNPSSPHRVDSGLG